MNQAIEAFQNQVNQENFSLCHVAILAMTVYIENSTELTAQGLTSELQKFDKRLIDEFKKMKEVKRRSTLPITTSCDLFLHNITTAFSDSSQDFESIKKDLVQQGKALVDMTGNMQDKIKQAASRIFKDNSNILIHGHSRTVENILIDVHRKGIQFQVYITECRPTNEGYQLAENLIKAGLKGVKMIIDIAVGKIMPQIDFILSGAEAVVENGGIINVLGTYTLALAAKPHKKPIYVVSESLKFARKYPLSQNDVPQFQSFQAFNQSPYEEINQQGSDLCDYTPPEYINLLITDIGIFTPPAVSDELIQLYCK